MLLNKLNEFADSTFTFGEQIFKRMEEVSLIKENLRVTADKIANKSAEISNSIFKRTRDSITQINQSSKMTQLKEKASDKFNSWGGKLWGVSIIRIYLDIL